MIVIDQSFAHASFHLTKKCYEFSSQETLQGLLLFDIDFKGNRQSKHNFASRKDGHSKKHSAFIYCKYVNDLLVLIIYV